MTEGQILAANIFAWMLLIAGACLFLSQVPEMCKDAKEWRGLWTEEEGEEGEREAA